MRQRIELLLLADSRSGDFLESPAMEDQFAGIGIPLAQPASFSTSSDFDESEACPAEEYLSADPPAPPMPDLSFLAPSSVPGVLGELQHYQVHKVLGVGSFGIVLQATDTKLTRQVAIKVLHPVLAQTSPPRKRFLREARALAAVRHPNLVHIYAVESEPLPFLVMELVPGPTLQDRIHVDGPLELDELLDIARQLALALTAAHAQGVIHRDIKPANILLEYTTNLRAVLTDFGLARSVEDASMTRTGVIAGTPMYMSPEQATLATVDDRADLFSLGSVLYVMITGRPPFRANSMVGVLMRVAQATPRPIPEIVPDCPTWLCDLVERLMRKDPAERIQSSSEVGEIIAAGIAGELATPPAPSEATTTIPRLIDKRLVVRRQRPHVLARVLRLAFILLPLMAFYFVEGSVVRRWMDQLVPAPSFVQKQPVTEQPVSDKADGPSSTAASTPSRAAPPATSTPAKRPETTAGDSTNTATHKLFPADAPLAAIAPFDRFQAVSLQEQWADYLQTPVEFTDTLGITFRLIPPGESSAGSTRPFYLASTELTQLQFDSVMSYHPSYFSESGGGAPQVAGLDTDAFPVESVSWQATNEFLKRLNSRWRLPTASSGSEAASVKLGYRLPTETEWELACRAGSAAPFWYGQDPASISPQDNFAKQRTTPRVVATGVANPFGLHDVHGNVGELVADALSTSQDVPAEGLATASSLVIVRGGDWDNAADLARSAARRRLAIDEVPAATTGIRLAMDVATLPRVHAPNLTAEVGDFSVLHGATTEQFQEWLTGLRGKLVPTAINLRSGAEEPIYDALARECPPNLRWRLNRFNNDVEAGQDYNRMKGGYGTFWRTTIPTTGVVPAKCAGLSLWIAKEGGRWGTWNIWRRNVQPVITANSRQGQLINSICVAYSGGTRNSHYLQVSRPGVGNHPYADLTLADFIAKADKYRARGWRLHFLQLHTGTPELRIACTFRENSAGYEWELETDLSASNLEAMLVEKRKAGYHPVGLASYQEADRVRYLVVWQQKTAPRVATTLN
ncbi:bifunctional serine/threonine-protein kinase/formylglycine-generating enzyme family protein [Planctomycetaceae bacterium SH139]